MPHSSKKLRKLKNISLPGDPCTDARASEPKLSHAAEIASWQAVDVVGYQLWASENAEFIAEYNKRINAEGTLLHEWCTF